MWPTVKPSAQKSVDYALWRASRLDRSRATGSLPVSLERRPCHASAHAATDPSHPQALPPRRTRHLFGRSRRRGVGALPDGPHALLHVRFQALARRPRRRRGVAAPDRLVHLQPRPARLYFLLAAVGRLARPSVGGGPAADRHPDRGGLGALREFSLHDRPLSRAHDLARLHRRQHRQFHRRHAGDAGRASCSRRGCRPG